MSFKRSWHRVWAVFTVVPYSPKALVLLHFIKKIAIIWSRSVQLKNLIFHLGDLLGFIHV